MSYTKTNWQTGDVIDAEKLNKMEQGIKDANGILNGDTVTSATDTDTVFIDRNNVINKITLPNLVAYVKNKIGSLKNPNALTFTGAVNETYDGSVAKTIDIPSGGTGTSYVLPIASADNLGGVKPVAKTDEMTQEVGIDSAGLLYTASSNPSGAGSSEYELLCNQSFDLDGTGTSIEVPLPASPKGFVLYLAIQVDSPATTDTMTFSVDGATIPSYFGNFTLTTASVTVKKWFCDSVVTENLMYMGGGDSNSIQTAIKMVRGNIAHMAIGSPTGDGKLVVGVPGKVGTLYIRAYMRY